MKLLKVIMCLLLAEIILFIVFAQSSHNNGDVCFATNDWHWYDSQDDAAAPKFYTCPQVVFDAPAASGYSIFEHHALQALSIMIPITSAVGVIVGFRIPKK